MSRLATPVTIDAAPAASRPMLEAVKKQLGVAPHLFRLVSNSPAALEGYLALSGALSKGSISAATGERIALAIAEIMAATTACRPTPTLARTSPSWTTRR